MGGDQLEDQLRISSRPNTWTIYAWFLVHSPTVIQDNKVISFIRQDDPFLTHPNDLIIPCVAQTTSNRPSRSLAGLTSAIAVIPLPNLYDKSRQILSWNLLLGVVFSCNFRLM